MRLVHLTDPHLTTPPAWPSLLGRSHGGKRLLGHASWSRKRRRLMRREWLDELTATVKDLHPDQILISGDLTQIGTEEEILEARQWLETFAPPEQVLFVPGNHDVYARESLANVARQWAPYLHLTDTGTASGAENDSGRAAEWDSQWPTIHRFDQVQVFGLSTALPTRPLSACGLLGVDQLRRLEQALQATGETFNVLILHHPPLPGMIKFRKRLRDAAALAGVLERAEPGRQVSLVLHGHGHRNRTVHGEHTRIYSTAPASCERASFRVFDIDRDGANWSVLDRLMQRDAGSTFTSTEENEWRVSVPE